MKYQFGKSEQGIDLYQDYAEIYANGRKQVVHYNEVQKFASGKLTYMLELKNRTVVIVPKRALADSADQAKQQITVDYESTCSISYSFDWLLGL